MLELRLDQRAGARDALASLCLASDWTTKAVWLRPQTVANWEINQPRSGSVNLLSPGRSGLALRRFFGGAKRLPASWLRMISKGSRKLYYTEVAALDLHQPLVVSDFGELPHYMLGMR